MNFNNPLPTPTNFKVLDPGHHVFTGTGEPATNLPDADGFVNYYPYMSISSQPTVLRGNIATTSFYYMYMFVPTGSGWSGPTQYSGTQVEATTGSFTYPLTTIPDGSYSIQWIFINSSYMSGSQYVYLKFIDGPPPPPNQITSCNYPSWNYYYGNALDKRVPTISGLASPYTYPQTIWLKGQNVGGTFGTQFQYAQVVLPAGQSYPNTAGVYDAGEPFQDLDQNGKRTATEPFFDIAGKGVSDGKTFSIPNFMNIEFPNNLYYSYPVYIYARGPAYDSGYYYFSYWFTDFINPISVQDVTLTPSNSTIYRKSSQKPTSLLATVYKPSGNSSPDQVYGLATTASKIWISNNLGVNVLAPVASWAYVGSPQRFTSNLNLSAVPFGQGTYKVNVLTQTVQGVQSTNTSATFKIDDGPPQAQEFVPAEGSVANGFSSFNAKVVDPFLADNSDGSGANLDVALPQIWPFRLLTLTTKGGNNADLTMTLVDGETVPKDHLGNTLAVGTPLEAWEVSGGVYQNASHVCTLSSIGPGTITVTKADNKFVGTKYYVVLFPIPCFTANNGLDRVGAVPINPITEDAQYVCRAITLDKANNSGTFYAPYSRLEMAVGTITLTPTKTFLFLGLVPPDAATFTSNSIYTRKGNLIQDNQAVTVQRSPDTLTEFSIPDANGLPGDGYQVLSGRNGAPAGQGQFAFGVGVTGTSNGTLTTIAGIGLASGSSPAIPIVMMNSFTINPATTTPAITPANPQGTVSISTSFLGYSGTAVPEGSLATWTTSSAILGNPPGAGCTMSGFNTSYWYPNGISNNNWGDAGLIPYDPSWNPPNAGAFMNFDFGSPKGNTSLKVGFGGPLDLIWDVQYSDDNAVWTTVYSGFKPTGPGFGDMTITWAPCGSHRYWRMLLTNTPTVYYYYIYDCSWYSDTVLPVLTMDASPLPGFQTVSTSGSTAVSLSVASKGSVGLTAAMGMRTATCNLTFLDRYPPTPPTGLVASPSYTQGSVTCTWASSTDFGGAGMGDYLLSQSFASGAFQSVGTTTAFTLSRSLAPDGAYLFQVRGRDLDGNIGNPSSSALVIVDTVAPPAIACSDVGPDNLDPDEHFSVDSYVTFYFTPTDDRSGPGEINIQVASTSDFSVICHDVWVPAATSYQWTSAPSGFLYFARVRVKDRAGNIGAFGASSNGIVVNYTGATTPPNAPTITSIDGKPAIPGTPVSTKLTTGIAVSGMCEASNLIEIWVNGTYLKSMIAAPDGTYSHSIDLPAGQYLVKTRSHNGFAMSGFSTEFRIIIDTTPPTLDLRIYMTGDWLVDRNWVARQGNAHNITYVNLVVTDAGGAGFDINTASITVMDIDDLGEPIPADASYPNPISGGMSILTADTARFVPSPSWAATLQDQHRYRIFYEATDLAGNRKYQTRDIAVDNLRPGQAAGVPATSTPPLSDFRKLYIFNAEVYPSALPPATACVPLVWSDPDNAFMVDPGYPIPCLSITPPFPRPFSSTPLGSTVVSGAPALTIQPQKRISTPSPTRQESPGAGDQGSTSAPAPWATPTGSATIIGPSSTACILVLSISKTRRSAVTSRS